MLQRALRALGNNSGWMLLAFLFSLSGLGWIAEPSQFAPYVVLEELSRVLIRVFGTMLCFGSFLIFVGTVASKPYLERSGLCLWIPVPVMYVYIQFTAEPIIGAEKPQRGFSIIVFLVFASFLIARFRELGKIIRGYRKASEVAWNEQH